MQLLLVGFLQVLQRYHWA